MSESKKKLLNRPWKNPVVLKRPKLLNLYKKLDEVYNIYLTYNFNKHCLKFDEEVYTSLGFYPTSTMVSYFKNFGDPSKDLDWIEFTERV